MYTTRLASPTDHAHLTFTAFHPRKSQQTEVAAKTVVPEAARRQLRTVLAAAMIGEGSSVARCVRNRVERSSQSMYSIQSVLLTTHAGRSVDAVAVAVGDDHQDGPRPFHCAVHADGWIVTDAPDAHVCGPGLAAPTDAPWVRVVDAICSHLFVLPLPEQRTFADLIVAEWADRLIAACLGGSGPKSAGAAYALFPSPEDGARLSAAAFRSPDGPALARAAFDRLPDPDEIMELLPAIAPRRAQQIIQAALLACAAHRGEGIYPIRLA